MPPAPRRIIAPAVVLAALLVALTGSPTATDTPRPRPVAASTLPATCTSTVPVGRILTVGDSITAPGLWQQQLAQRLDAACADYTIWNSGIGGYGTKEANAALSQLLTAVKPKLVIYGMGINDDYTGFRDRYWGSMGLIRQWAPAGVRIIPMFIQHMGPAAPAWISAYPKNDDIYADTFWNGARFGDNVVGYMSNNQIPYNAVYQTSDGIHLTAAGQVKAGDQAYRGMTRWGAYPLPALPDDPDLCPSACP